MNNLKFHIIVIDDNPAIHRDFIKILKTDNTQTQLNEFDAALFGKSASEEADASVFPEYIIDSASQGAEGIVKIREALEQGNPYALAFVDIRMPPGMDGIETIKQIWEIDSDIQVVICTAYSDYTWEDTITSLGVSDSLLIIKKPFDVVAVRQMTTALTRKWLLTRDSKKQSDYLKQIVDERTESLKQSLSLLRATIESSSDGILVVDLDKNIIDYNAHFVELWAIPLSILKQDDGHKLFEYLSSMILSPSDYLRQINLNDNNIDDSSSLVIKLLNEKVFDCRSKPHRVNNIIVGRVWSYSDITEQALLKQKLEYQATHDALTQLPNRLLLIDRMEIAIKSAIRYKTKCGILFFDLDRFKSINDSLGHEAGDELLCAVAQRLSETIRKVDTLARLGGDEFVIILPGLKNEKYLGTFVHKILESVNKPFKIANQNISITTSIGISVYPEDGEDISQLLSHADLSMYQAKARGGNQFVLYSNQFAEQINLEFDLNNAIENNEFILEYQPQLDIKTNKIESVEALIRWQHPVRGTIQPADFIPAAESSRLIIRIGEWVIREVCKQIALWKKQKLLNIRVAINVATLQLKQHGFPQKLQAILQEYQVDPKFIEIEITENVFVDLEVQNAVLALSQIGFNIVLDDFGTGSTSLNSLKQLQLTRLKIDRSFVNNIAKSRGDEVIIEAILAIAKTLDYKVVAEGVETQEQYNFLKMRNCNEMQGFLLSKPMSAKQLVDFLRAGYS